MGSGRPVTLQDMGSRAGDVLPPSLAWCAAPLAYGSGLHGLLVRTLVPALPLACGWTNSQERDPRTPEVLR